MPPQSALHCSIPHHLTVNSPKLNFRHSSVTFLDAREKQSRPSSFPARPIHFNRSKELSCCNVITCPWHTGPSRPGTPSPGHSAPSTDSPPSWPGTPPCSPSSICNVLCNINKLCYQKWYFLCYSLHLEATLLYVCRSQFLGLVCHSYWRLQGAMYIKFNYIYYSPPWVQESGIQSTPDKRT